MGRNRKTYTESFKKAVAVEAIEGKKQVAEIASDHGISPSMVTTWKKAFLDGDFNKELKKRTKELEESNKQLETATIALGKARLEIEIIKKKLNIKD